MKTRDVDTLCAIAARLLQDAASLRDLGCERVAVLLEEAEHKLDAHVYGGGCTHVRNEAESTTH